MSEAWRDAGSEMFAQEDAGHLSISHMALIIMKKPCESTLLHP